MVGWTPPLFNTLGKLILDALYNYPLSELTCAHCFQSLISVTGICRQSATVICHPWRFFIGTGCPPSPVITRSPSSGPYRAPGPSGTLPDSSALGLLFGTSSFPKECMTRKKEVRYKEHEPFPLYS